MKQKNNPVKKAKNHSPFGLRKAILFAGIVSGLVSGYFLKNDYTGLCIHLAVATLVDQLFHYGFHLKASSFVDKKQLLDHEEISPEALDRHYDAKRNIRLLSLVLAGTSQVVFLSPELFLGVFATSTLVGRFYAWYQLDIVGPKVVHELDEFVIVHSTFPIHSREKYNWDSSQELSNISQGLATGTGSCSYLNQS